MPPMAYRYAIPNRFYEIDAIRKYGFHGTSHRFAAKEAAERLVTRYDVSDLRVVSAHLGNGCSVTASRGGRSLDTSMGKTIRQSWT